MSAGLHVAVGDWPKIDWVAVVEPAVAPYAALVAALVIEGDVQKACESAPFDAGSLFSALEPIDYSVRPLVDAACGLCVGLQSMSAQAICGAAAALLDAEKRTTMVPPSTRSAVRLLAQYMENFASTLVHQSELPAWFVHDTPDAGNKRWWDGSPSIGTTIYQLTKAFRDTLTKEPPEAFCDIPRWLEARRGVLLKLQLASSASSPGQFGATESDVFRTASTVHAYSAEIHYSRGNYSLALLFLHRACEWLIASLCASNSLLDFTHRHGYRLLSAPLNPPGFDMIIGALLAKDPVALRGSSGPFDQLNWWRNLLAHTHHMSAPRQDVATALYKQIQNSLPGIGGKAWKDALAVLQQPFPLTVRDVLDPHRLLRTGFKVEAADQLGIEALAST